MSSWGATIFQAKPDINAPDNAFLRVLGQVELGHKILEGLASSYFSMANLAATCVTAFRIIDEKLTVSDPM